MNNIDDIELHDALLTTMETDFAAKTVRIALEYYATSEDAKRTGIMIIFEGVGSISQIADVGRLQQNAFAGNVNYWRAGENGMSTYIYLSDGCIAITAEKISIQVNEIIGAR